MKSFLVYTTTGPTDPTKIGLAFTVAANAAAKGHKVHLFLAHDAVLCGQTETAEKIVPIGPPPLKDILPKVIDSDIEVLVCGACFEARKLSQENIIPGAKLVGVDRFVELCKTCEVISF